MNREINSVALADLHILSPAASQPRAPKQNTRGMTQQRTQQLKRSSLASPPAKYRHEPEKVIRTRWLPQGRSAPCAGQKFILERRVSGNHCKTQGYKQIGTQRRNHVHLRCQASSKLDTRAELGAFQHEPADCRKGEGRLLFQLLALCLERVDRQQSGSM